MTQARTTPIAETPRRQGVDWMGQLARFGPALALLLLVIFTATFSPSFRKAENIRNILDQQSAIGIIAVGMTFVIIQGGIDLGVGSLLAFVGGLGVLAMNQVITQQNGAVANEAAGVLVGFGVMLAAGAAAGGLNGLLISKGKVAAFIVTLGALAAYRSGALAMANGGEFRSQSPELFAILGSGGIPIPGTNLAPRAPEPIPLTLPWSVVLFFVVVAAAFVLLRYTRYGRYIYAIGCNPRAALYSGIPVDRVRILTYTLAGLTAGLGACVVASRLNSVTSSDTGLMYELDAIAAVVIGGTRMRGGAGSVLGTVVGVLILGVIGNMLNMLDVSSHLQGLVKGLIIVAAVLIQRQGE